MCNVGAPGTDGNGEKIGEGTVAGGAVGCHRLNGDVSRVEGTRVDGEHHGDIYVCN